MIALQTVTTIRVFTFDGGVFRRYFVRVAELLSFALFLNPPDFSLHHFNILLQLLIILLDHRVEDLVPLNVVIDKLAKRANSVFIQFLPIVSMQVFFVP